MIANLYGLSLTKMTIEHIARGGKGVFIHTFTIKAYLHYLPPTFLIKINNQYEWQKESTDLLGKMFTVHNIATMPEE